MVGSGAESQGDQAVRVPGQDPHVYDGGGGGGRGRAGCYPRQRRRQGIVFFLSNLSLSLSFDDFLDLSFFFIPFYSPFYLSPCLSFFYLESFALIQGEDMMEDEGIHQDEEDEVAYKGRSNSSR